VVGSALLVRSGIVVGDVLMGGDRWVYTKRDPKSERERERERESEEKSEN
jgi:hypothetical protein